MQTNAREVKLIDYSASGDSDLRRDQKHDEEGEREGDLEINQIKIIHGESLCMITMHTVARTR